MQNIKTKKKIYTHTHKKKKTGGVQVSQQMKHYIIKRRKKKMKFPNLTELQTR